jgi:hypothetical protein
MIRSDVMIFVYSYCGMYESDCIWEFGWKLHTVCKVSENRSLLGTKTGSPGIVQYEDLVETDTYYNYR